DRIMDLSLFKYPVFTISMLISAIRSVALFGGVFLLPLFLQQLKGLSAVQSGLMLLPGTLVMALAMPIIGWLSDRSSPRILSLIGMGLMAYSMFLFTDISIYMSNWRIVYPTMIRGVGMCFLMAPIMSLALGSVPRRKTGMASSMLSIIQQVGGAMGIAILSTVLDSRTKFHLAAVGAAISTNSTALRSTVQGLAERAHQLGYTAVNSLTVAQAAITKDIYVACSNYGFQDAFIFATIIIIVSIVPVFFLPNKNVTKHPDEIVVVE
ncbi:MAG TPA: MFS transporter, partial [Candidatus Sulfotelmatobacter sp.]|nr:MFS transporter [Candidatus Sulfotelmatobacter sp.]